MKRIVAYTALALVLSLLALILLSWLLSATMTVGVRSLLSSEGIRWFFGHFTDIMLRPQLVWLILLAMAWGAFKQSGMASVPSKKMRVFLLILLSLYVGVILLLTAIPHAVLLSATGTLWPSPFSQALVPIVAFGVTMLSVAYGVLSGTFHSLSSVCQALSWGIGACAPLFLLYILFMQLYGSLCFVF